MSRDREGQTQLHPARVALHRRVDERPDVRELDDLVEATLDLLALHVEDRAVQEDVLAPGQLRMEARTDLEEGPDPAAKACLALRRRRDPREDLEQGALAGPVVADDAERLPAPHLEVDVAEGPELLVGLTAPKGLHPLRDALSEQHVAALVRPDLVALSQAPDVDCDLGAHMRSAKKFSARRK